MSGICVKHLTCGKCPVKGKWLGWTVRLRSACLRSLTGISKGHFWVCLGHHVGVTLAIYIWPPRTEQLVSLTPFTTMFLLWSKWPWTESPESCANFNLSFDLWVSSIVSQQWESWLSLKVIIQWDKQTNLACCFASFYKYTLLGHSQSSIYVSSTQLSSRSRASGPRPCIYQA